MAQQGAYTNTYLTLGGTDVSAQVISASLKKSYSTVTTTAMSATPAETSIPAVQSWSLEVEFNQDFSASAVNSVVNTAFDGKSTLAIVFRPNNANAGVGNPQYAGTAYVYDYNPVDATIGQRATTKVTFTGTGYLTTS